MLLFDESSEMKHYQHIDSIVISLLTLHSWLSVHIRFFEIFSMNYPDLSYTKNSIRILKHILMRALLRH